MVVAENAFLGVVAGWPSTGLGSERIAGAVVRIPERVTSKQIVTAKIGVDSGVVLIEVR